MGITILEGREFPVSDDSASRSLIIDETLARRFYPNGGAVGQPVAFGGDSIRYQVIGVVASVALVAAWIPARRAIQADPADVLKADS